MNKFLIRAVFLLSLTTVLLFNSFSVFAAGDEEPTVTPEPEVQEEESDIPVYGGVPVYGGGIISPREGEVIVEKKVLNPATGVFVDHLGPTDPKYKPLDIIAFQIRVQNSAEEELAEINLVDTLPDFVDFSSGPGEYDEKNRQLNFKVENLVGGASEVFEIKVRASHQSTFPEEESVLCPVNVIEATVEDKTDRDESQFCIEKEVAELEPQETPEAGPFNWLLLIPGLLGSMSVGSFLRRKTK